jgi:broad specificity phosphatase PhoE
MTKLILIRHGETTWNDAQRFQGLIDVPLNARGWREAECLAWRFEDERIDAIYSSDLSRALDTATVIAQRVNQSLVVEPRLREACLGELQGKTYAEVHDRWFRAVETTPCYFMDAAPRGVESLRQLQARLMETIRDIATHHRDASVLLVTHGAW